jgi:hypothetical protein
MMAEQGDSAVCAVCHTCGTLGPIITVDPDPKARSSIIVRGQTAARRAARMASWTHGPESWRDTCPRCVRPT